MLAPDLGDDPLTCSECFMIATKKINPGDWFTWYYGHFHGILKRACDDATGSSDDEEDDDSEADLDENDSEDDVNMAVTLSAQLAEDHRLALELQQSLDHEADYAKIDAKSGFDSKQNEKEDVVDVESSDSGTNGTARKTAKRNLNPLPSGVTKDKALYIDDKCYIRSTAPNCSDRFQSCYVKSRKSDILTGLVTHYDVSYGKPATRCLIEAVKAQDDLAAYSSAKRGRVAANTIARQAEQEAIRQESVRKYRKGELNFVPGPSPGQSPVRGHVSGVEDDAMALGAFSAGDVDLIHHDDDREVEADDQDDHVSEAISEEGNTNTNESALEALEMQKAALTIELSTISAEDIWKMFHNKIMKGGVMARTLFIAGKALEPKLAEPWIGDKKLASKKADVIDQRSLFVSWASAPRVLDWIRLEIFKIVLQKPQTYRTFNVTHVDGPKAIVSVNGKDVLQATQASNSTMARVAHLACCAHSRVVLNMLFGTKTREGIDARDLQPEQLWQDLASVYVNNPHWDIRQIDVLQLQHDTDPSSKIDVSQVGPIGLTAECVRLVFTDIKKMYADLENAIHGRTGCNTVGEECYGKAWKNYIKGGLMFFARPEVAMYVFKLWSECEGLPKYCMKELHPEAQVRIGIMRNQKFGLTTTPRGSTPRGSSGSQFTSPPTPSTDTTNSLDTIVSFLSYKVQEMKQQEDITARASSVAAKPQVKL